MLPLHDVRDGLAPIMCFRLGGFLPVQHMMLHTCTEVVGLRFVSLVGILDKLVPQMTWMCSRVNVST